MSNNKQRLNYNILIFSILSCIQLTSCYESREGCLDANATNYDVSADENCCCQYPNLKLTLTHRADTVFIYPDSIYTNNIGKSFSIKNFKYYISDVQLQKTDGTVISNNDSLTVFSYENGNIIQKKIWNNFVYVDRGVATTIIGSFSHTGQYSKVLFKVGVVAEANHILPDTLLPNNHALLRDKGMYIDSLVGYNHIQLRYVLTTDTITTTVFGIGAVTSVELPWEHTLRYGYDLDVPILANYLRWFDDVTFDESQEVLRAKLLTNTPKVFSITP
ncbi:MAG: hypothetical protein KA974_05040 [Saprospiraceae bacterium]|nr:hypothetical protein [Saprospiraceae bacterium]MBP7699770.1 hypothetical protein [Saprospiraceae bacterium]